VLLFSLRMNGERSRVRFLVEVCGGDWGVVELLQSKQELLTVSRRLPSSPILIRQEIGC
jgi:hypothetical protein